MNISTPYYYNRSKFWSLLAPTLLSLSHTPQVRDACSVTRHDFLDRHAMRMRMQLILTPISMGIRLKRGRVIVLCMVIWTVSGIVRSCIH